jgi:hypothetical protein
MYVVYRSYVGRVLENLKRDACPRRHLPKTEEEDYNGLKRDSKLCCCVCALFAKKKMDSTRVCRENSCSLR